MARRLWTWFAQNPQTEVDNITKQLLQVLSAKPGPKFETKVDIFHKLFVSTLVITTYIVGINKDIFDRSFQNNFENIVHQALLHGKAIVKIHKVEDASSTQSQQALRVKVTTRIFGMATSVLLKYIDSFSEEKHKSSLESNMERLMNHSMAGGNGGKELKVKMEASADNIHFKECPDDVPKEAIYQLRFCDAPKAVFLVFDDKVVESSAQMPHMLLNMKILGTRMQQVFQGQQRFILGDFVIRLGKLRINNEYQRMVFCEIEHTMCMDAKGGQSMLLELFRHIAVMANSQEAFVAASKSLEVPDAETSPEFPVEAGYHRLARQYVAHIKEDGQKTSRGTASSTSSSSMR